MLRSAVLFDVKKHTHAQITTRNSRSFYNRDNSVVRGLSCRAQFARRRVACFVDDWLGAAVAETASDNDYYRVGFADLAAES